MPMKKKVAAVCAALLLLAPQMAFAAPADTAGDADGVNAGQPMFDCPTWLWWLCGTSKQGE